MVLINIYYFFVVFYGLSSGNLIVTPRIGPTSQPLGIMGAVCEDGTGLIACTMKKEERKPPTAEDCLLYAVLFLRSADSGQLHSILHQTDMDIKIKELE
jgi:hypothetical protein